MVTIINIETHAIQGSSVHKNNWMGDGWVIVPPELEAEALASGGFCELTFDDAGNLVGLTPTERPADAETTKRTPQDDIDAMLVDHEYRLTLLELGVSEEV